MKEYLNIILLVEGQHDKNKILSIFDVEIYVLNGFNIDKKLINYLTFAKKFKQIAILSDPDEAGVLIRKRLISLMPFLDSITVDPLKCDKHGKHGIAECENNELTNKLQNYKSRKNVSFIDKDDFYSLGLIGKTKSRELRNLVADHFNVYNCSTETIIMGLNTLKISKDLLWKYLETISLN